MKQNTRQRSAPPQLGLWVALLAASAFLVGISGIGAKSRYRAAAS
jgi:hypothetical protein